MLELRITYDQVEPYHSTVATSVAWNGVDELISCGDDHQILSWDLLTNETSTIIELPPDVYPISMEWPPQGMGGVSTGRKVNETLLVTSSDGSFYFFGKGNRLEKTVQAHQGAIISGSWSPNGSEILTSGEDGYLRIWSRTGMLRTVLAQHHMAIYSSAWAPDGRSVLYALDKSLLIRQTVAGSRILEWKAHDGLILCVAWNAASNLIVSGGEDCRYRVWEVDGRCLYTSPLMEHPIVSLGWAPSGEFFAVGGSDMIRLCDRFGWTHCIENPRFGSVYSLEWSGDGTQFAGATSEGHVFVANVVMRSCIWKNVEATLTAQNEITVYEFKVNGKDQLDFEERVIHMSMNFGYLIVVLPTQVYIYNVTNIPTHVVCELKEPNSIYLTLQSKRNFILCGYIGIMSRSYDGRQLTHIKWPGMQSGMLNVRTTSLAEDMIALIDQGERKVIRVFDTHNGRLLHEERTNAEVIQVALAQNDMSGPTERQLAYIDKSLELFLTVVKRQGKPGWAKRLGTATTSILWHIESPMLVTVWENKVKLYYYPQVLFLDETLLEHTTDEKELGDLGPSPELVSYMDSFIRLRKADGTMICATGSYFVPQLYTFAAAGNFGKARRICRYVNDRKLWGVLAGLATSRGELDTAELCFSEIGQYHKVEFLSHMQKIPDELTQKSQKQLFIGGIQKGEAVLLQEGRISEAIYLNVDCMNWERALELMLKYKEDPKELFEKRQEFLESINLEEFAPRFLELGDYLNSQAQKQEQEPKNSEKTVKATKKEIQKATEEEVESDIDLSAD